MIVVIPAYEPDEKLLRLVDELKQQTDYKIIIVDDGSKNAESKDVFSKLEADSAVTLLHHKVNRGKGRAMKTAFEYIKDAGFSDDGIITVDADGQHLIKDIVAVSETWAKNPNALVLGQTFFRQGTAPQQIRQRCNTRRVCNFNGRSRLRHADGASCVFNRKA
ncbi:MAG: glycosyltransferase family 2 protein [Christensenellaceae bacterium]